jgi:hypothetical protein
MAPADGAAGHRRLASENKMGRPFVPAIPLPHVKRKAAAAAAAAAATTNATPPSQPPGGSKEDHNAGEATAPKAELNVSATAKEHRGTQDLVADENVNPTMNGEGAAHGELPTQRKSLARLPIANLHFHPDKNTALAEAEPTTASVEQVEPASTKLHQTSAES